MFKLTVIIATIAMAAAVAVGQAPTLQIVTPDGPTFRQIFITAMLR